jgi:membrane protease YdiL (CAAX protease family)
MQNLRQPNTRQALPTALIFLILGGLVGGSAYVAFLPTTTRIILKVLNVALSLCGWLVVRRVDRLKIYKPLFLAFFAVSLGVLSTHYFAPYALTLLGLTPTTAKGVALAKFSEALPIIASILLVHFATGGNRDEIFLRVGNLRFGLVAAVIGVGIFLGIAAIQAIGSNIQGRTIASALPWILIFTLTNAFLEELWFRALFLKKLEPLVGIRSAIVISSLVFGLIHISSTYVIDILLFVPTTIILGLIWAWLMHRSQGIWSPVLIHAAGDVLVMVGLLAGATI